MSVHQCLVSQTVVKQLIWKNEVQLHLLKVIFVMTMTMIMMMSNIILVVVLICFNNNYLQVDDDGDDDDAVS